MCRRTCSNKESFASGAPTAYPTGTGCHCLERKEVPSVQKELFASNVNKEFFASGRQLPTREVMIGEMVMTICVHGYAFWQ